MNNSLYCGWLFIKQSIGKRRFKTSSYKSKSGAPSQLCELWEKKPVCLCIAMETPCFLMIEPNGRMLRQKRTGVSGQHSSNTTRNIYSFRTPQ